MKPEQRKKLYELDPKKYDKAFVVVMGGLLALNDYIEDANEVLPEMFPNNLKYSVEDALNNLYGKRTKFDASKVGDEQNKIAELFRIVIEKIQ